MNRGEHIARLYKAGGPSLLAYRLGHIFTHITTDAERALHNDALSEVLEMTNGQEKTFLLSLSESIVYQKPPSKRFVFRVAEKILDLGRSK